MAFKLDLNNKIPESTLIIEPNLVGEVIDVNSDYLNLKIYFSVNLSSKLYNPLLYKKVNISVLTDEQKNYLTTPFKNNNFLNNSSNTIKKNILGKNTVNQIGTSESKLSLFSAPNTLRRLQNLNSQTAFKNLSGPNEIISLESQIKYNKYRTIKQSIKNSDGDNTSVTSQTIYIDQKVISAMKTAVDFTDLDLPEYVNITQEKLLLNDQTSNSSDLKISQELVNSKTTIDRAFNSIALGLSDTSTLNEKILIDYLIHNSSKLTKKDLNALNYYTKKKSKKFIDKLSLSVDFKIKKTYLDKDLFVKFDLFSKDTPDNAGLSKITNLNLKELLNKYYKNIKPINITCSSRQIDSSIKENTFSFSCQQEDDKKISSYNLYVKNLLSQDNKNFAFLEKIEKNKSYVSLQANNCYSLCYRAKPVTLLGESYVFSDFIINSLADEKTLFEPNDSIFFNVRQINSNSFELTISHDNENSSNQIRKIKIYKRNCTLSPDAPFYVYATEYLTASGISGNIQKIVDENILVNNFYEYYVELIDQYENIVKTSLPKLLQSRFVNNTSFSVNISNVTLSPDSVQFTIQTETLKLDNPLNLLKEQLDKLRINAVPTQEASNNSNDYSITAYHKVTRIDLVSNKRETFELITDGAFSDDADTRRKFSISDPIVGRNYMYLVESFKRDPVTISKEFLAIGTNSQTNKKWFYRPSKWMHPHVLNTGILLEENENNGGETYEETFMSDFIGTSVVSDISFTIDKRILQVSEVTANRDAMSTVKISWNSQSNLIDQFDSFIVCKVVNGKKSILGITSEPYLYHTLDNEDDLGTLFYEVTPIKNDYTVLETHMSNPIMITQNLTGKF